MSNSPEAYGEIDSVEALQRALLGTPQTNQLDAAPATAAYSADEPERAAKRSVEYSTGRTAAQTALGILAVGVIGTGAVLIGNHMGMAEVLRLKATDHTSVLDGGEGNVVKIDTTRKIVLDTNDTDTKNIGVEFHQNIQALGFINFNANGRSLQHDATVRTELTAQPKEIEVAYTKNTKQMVFVIGKTAVEANSDVKDGSTHDHNVRGSVTSFLIKNNADVLETIGGVANIDPSDIPFIGKMATGEWDIDTGLDNVADLVASRQVDKYCTPKVTKNPEVKKQIIENIKEGMQADLYDMSNASKPGFKGLKDFYALNDLKEMNKIVKNAKVEFKDGDKTTGDITFTTSSNKDLRAYLKTGLFKDSTDNATAIPAMKCGIDKSAVLKDPNKK